VNGYSDYITIDRATRRVEFRELTDVMAENLSEIATVVSLNFIGGKTTVWEGGVPRVEHIDRSALMELKRRALWRDGHLGWVS